MISWPSGWRVERFGADVALVHPRGEAVGTIAYRDRLRPLRRVGALVRQHLAALPAFAADAISVPERFATYEGEHAALVTVLGRQAGVAVQRDLGFLFADDFFSLVDGLCFDEAERPRFTELVRELVRFDTQALGVRRRRFEYAPPPGWQPEPRSLATSWSPPGYPRDATRLVVYPADPLPIVPAFDAIVHGTEALGWQIETREPIEPLAFGALMGYAQSLRATAPGKSAMQRRLVLLADHVFGYLFELSSHSPETWERSCRELDALLRSVCPVPEVREFARGPNPFAHWVE